MPRISTDNYDTVASWNGSQDLFIVEQPDGTKVATPAMVKQFMEAGDFEATGEIKDGHGNILKDMAKSADIANLLITDTFTTEAKNYTAGTDGYCSVSGVIKSDYTLLGVIDLDANKTGFGLTTWHFNPGNSTVTAWIRPLVNITGLTITFKILYIKDLS